MSFKEQSTHQFTQSIGIGEGFDLVSCSECSPAEWDDCEDQYARNVEEFVRPNEAVERKAPMPAKLTIRTATMDDYPAVCRLLHELDDHHVRIRPDVFQPFDDPVRQRERIARFVNAADAEMFVAEINTEMVGLATVRISDNPDAPMFRPGRRACVDDLVVKCEFQGLGIAKRLLDCVTEWTQSQELQCININVWNDNKAGLSFFTTNGFTPRCQQMELRIDKAT